MPLQSDDSAPAPFSRKSRYILVVEGNTRDLFYTSMLLNRFNYPVCTARNARQALDMISVAMPSLVISDFQFSGMQGIELLRVLSSNKRTYSIPVIMLMPPGEEGGWMSAVEVGGRHFLQKPVQIEELFRAVQQVMELTPRANIRVRTQLPVTVNKVPLDMDRGECITHISSQGVYIRTYKYHSRKEQMALQTVINGRTIQADAKILYTKRQDDSPFAEPGMAVQFTRIMAEDRDYIRQFVRDELTRGIVIETQ